MQTKLTSKSVGLGALIFASMVGGVGSAHANSVSLLYRDSQLTVTVEAVDEAALLGLDGGILGVGYRSETSEEERPQSSFDKAKVVIDEVVELGAKLWTFISENKPVVDIAAQTASAVPQGATHWSDLEGWQTPRSRLFRLRFKNTFGATVVDLSYRIVYGWGGGVDGKGKFLSDVTVLPTDLSTSWGYKVNATSSVVGTVNTGTKKDPIAAMQLQLNFSVKTPLKQIDLASRYFVRGDGVLVDLASGVEYKD